ncbi:hypothetical protein [Methylomicrobium agile]|uniref:hypothetical protein n=1 Tax=Methylomicrobium agile TaxID=39774 RepID=UPI0004DF1152|nr:hypothetical protein [Methylomicrobium agile]
MDKPILPLVEHQDSDLVEFYVTTKVDDEKGSIIQETVQLRGREIINSIEKVIKTQDAGVREALIELGWTPPAEGVTKAPWEDKEDPLGR